MLPQELKELIDRYCMGVEPTDAQMNEIMDLMLSLDADAEEATEYMQERIAGPTLEELQAKENAKPANYDVILDNSGPAKLLIIKTIIEITKLPLDEAKSLMDNTPSVILTTSDKEKAEETLSMLLSKKAQAHIEKKEAVDLQKLEQTVYDFSEYEGYDIDELFREAERLIDSGDMRSAHMGVALLEHISNGLMDEINDPDELEEMLNILSTAKYYAILYNMPEEAPNALLEIKKLANNNYLPAYYFLFIAYSKGYGTSIDTDAAAQCAQRMGEMDDADTETDCLLINGYCALKGWGLNSPDEEKAKELTKKIVGLLEDSPEHSFDKHGQEMYDELLSNYKVGLFMSLIPDTPESIVDGIIDNMVGGFENINVFSKNDKFKVCKYLVTQKEWEVIMGNNPSWERSPNFPVVNITYAEAEEFVGRVNKIARSKGYEFQIPPTDWQWLGYQKKCADRYKHLDKDIIRAGASVFAWSEATSGGHLHNVGELQPLEGIYDSTGLVYEMGQTKKYNRYRYGAFNEPLKNVFGGESSELMYVDKRYDNLGLRLICME